MRIPDFIINRITPDQHKRLLALPPEEQSLVLFALAEHINSKANQPRKVTP